MGQRRVWLTVRCSSDKRKREQEGKGCEKGRRRRRRWLRMMLYLNVGRGREEGDIVDDKLKVLHRLETAWQ